MNKEEEELKEFDEALKKRGKNLQNYLDVEYAIWERASISVPKVKRFIEKEFSPQDNREWVKSILLAIIQTLPDELLERNGGRGMCSFLSYTVFDSVDWCSAGKKKKN